MSTKSQNLQIFITNCKKFLKIEQHVKELPIIEFPVIEFSKEKERQCQKRQCLSNLHSCSIHDDMIKLDMPYLQYLQRLHLPLSAEPLCI